MENLSQAEFDSLVDKRTVRKQFYQSMGRDGSSAQEEESSIEKLRETVRRMERALTNGPWIMGQQFTLADVGLIPTIVRMVDIGLGDIWEAKSRVAEWYARVQERPSFTKALYHVCSPFDLPTKVSQKPLHSTSTCAIVHVPTGRLE